MKANCQPYCMVSQAIIGGARIAPIDPPAWHRLFAVARSFPGNQMVVALMDDGKLVGSESPSIPLKKLNCPIVRDMPPPMQANDQEITPKKKTRRTPNLSTNQPDTGYMAA